MAKECCVLILSLKWCQIAPWEEKNLGCSVLMKIIEYLFCDFGYSNS